MSVSRRSLLRALGAGSLAGLAIPSLAEFSIIASAKASLAGPIRLNRNENGYGPPESVRTAVRKALERANRFPGAESDALLERIASLHACKPEQVILGCGSTEILRMCAAEFLGAGKKLLMASPSFDAMADCARACGGEVQVIPLNKMFAHDLGAMLSNVDGSTGLVYLCNPNNPTGSLTPRQEIEQFIRKLPAAVHVLIDEAYHHYAGISGAYASFIDHPIDDERIIVTRTFSKIYGLAGMRLGYGIAAPQTAGRIRPHRLDEGINVLAAVAGRVALDNSEFVKTHAQRNENARQEFLNQVHARMLRMIDSRANFILLNTGRPAAEVAENFRKNHVLVADGFAGMENHIRVSIGRTEDMREFWRVWDLLPPQDMKM